MNALRAETRKSPRVKAASNEVAYLNFPSGNGAIVVDVSSEGLGFQAAELLQPNESVTFRLCTSDLPNIDLAGKIVWLDETRKHGGLHLAVPENSRLALQEWQRRYFAALPKPEPPDKPTWPTDAVVEPPLKSSEPESKAVKPTANSAVRPSAGNPTPQPPMVPAAPNPSRRNSIFVSEWEYPPEESHIARNVLIVGAFLALGLIVAGVYYPDGRRQVGALLIRLGQSLAGSSSEAPLQRLATTNADALPPVQPNSRAESSSVANPDAIPQQSSAAMSSTPPVASTPAPSPANGAASASVGAGATQASAPATQPSAEPQEQRASAVPAASESQQQPVKRTDKSTPKKSAPAQPPASTKAHAERHASVAAPPDIGQSEVAQARNLLRSSAPENRALAANLLWSAVGKGNTQAEMMLADLYLEGRGAVRKNCEQAKILLKAAQSANVPGSTARLQNLQTYGCR
jgi:hypothetical protein